MRLHTLALVAAALLCRAVPSHGQMVTGKDMPGYAAAFGLGPERQARGWEIRQVAISTPSGEGANVLWPGEVGRFTFQVTGKAGVTLPSAGRLEVIRYSTSVPVGDMWTPTVVRQALCGSYPVRLAPGAAGSMQLVCSPAIPARFGGYAIILDLGPAGRAAAAFVVRTPRAAPGRVQFPTYALDLPWPHEISEAVTVLFEKLGVKGCRMGAGYYPTTAPDFGERTRDFDQHLAWAWKHRITCMLTVGEGGAPQPLGRPRPWLTPEGVMMDTKSDYAWLPEYDPDFRKWVAGYGTRFGWPRGPINAFELWNEPWEGISISGWGADMLRFRDMFTQMGLGVEDARRNGARVLIGGACSSSNTRDKLFPDGKETFLKWLDFVSIHYQPLAADPAVTRAWLARKGPYGPTRTWDTESWVANSDDRVAAVIASMRAQGQSRTAGIFHGNVYVPGILADRPRQGLCQAWAPAAAVAACQQFIGQRAFREILFKNGLPWVFVFDGDPVVDGQNRLPAGWKQRRPDDGTIVVVGDLGLVYNRDRVKFRNVLGQANLREVRALEARLAGLGPAASEADRKGLEAKLATARVLHGGTLSLRDGGGRFRLLDFYGNLVPARNGTITVPLDGLGYFLRTDGSVGSFARLVEAVRLARVRGLCPVDLVARDFTAPMEEGPNLRVGVTNVLNRAVTGRLTVRLAGRPVGGAPMPLLLKPNETREVALRVAAGPAAPSNEYPVALRFDAGRDGVSDHSEVLHVNVVGRRSITVDGDLSDWKGALPITVTSAPGQGRSLTEQAYLPFMPYTPLVAAGMATAYLGWDDGGFHFCVRIADATRYAGNVRFANRDDDRYFYPPTVRTREDGRELTWPAGIRRYSYRMDPDLPSGNSTDNVQLAFNVLPAAAKPWLPAAPGTMRGFMGYWDTDYEFALNSVAPRWGGGYEVWRLQAPGMPRTHWYPRQPHAANDEGPVAGAKLAVRYDGATRVVEATIPWAAMPEVRAAAAAGRTVKFTFRINDNEGPAMELAANRSVSREGNLTFHNDWASHWANELEFRFR